MMASTSQLGYNGILILWAAVEKLVCLGILTYSKMTKSSTLSNRVRLRLLRIPIWNFYRIRYIYRLSDFTYGQWLIFSNGLPVYYLDIFDERYSKFFDVGTGFLEGKFKEKGMALTFHNDYAGIRLEVFSYKWVDFDLEMLPVEFFH